MGWGIAVGFYLRRVVLPASGLERYYRKPRPAIPSGFDAIAELGTALTSPDAYVLPFEVASVLLVAALVGAVYVAFNPRNGDLRK